MAKQLTITIKVGCKWNKVDPDGSKCSGINDCSNDGIYELHAICNSKSIGKSGVRICQSCMDIVNGHKEGVKTTLTSEVVEERTETK